MRLIDADALIESANEFEAYGYVSAFEISLAPTVDAVQVVRCKDCRYCERYNDSDIYYCTYFENNYMLIPKPDYGYCSRGERKDDETD